MGTLNGFWPKCEDVILGFHYQDAKSCGSKAGGPMWTTHLLFGWYPILASGNQTWLENPGTKCKFLADHVPVVPARGGAEVALGIYIYIYKTFLIYRTCMRRAPAKPVRACILRKWCPVSHVTFEAPLRTSRFTLHTPHSTLHTSHFTLHTSHFTVHTSHFTVHTSHFRVHTSHFTVHTSHSTLHTALFTAPHFTLHPSHSTLHLIWALLTLSQLISSHLISSHMSSKLSWIISQYYY